MKVAYYSPLPPSRSGIADYSALLLPELERSLDLVVVRPGRFRRAPAADVRVYHVGNDAEAARLDRRGAAPSAGRRRPARARAPPSRRRHDDRARRQRRLPGGHGARGGLVTRLLAHAAIDHRISPIWDAPAHEFSLAREVLDHATGAIVHSRYVEDGVRRLGFGRPIWRIPHPAWPAPAQEPAAIEGSRSSAASAT